MHEDAWIELLHEHTPNLYRAVSRRVGAQRALAEDVTQETWLRALAAWRRSGVPDDPAAWLRTVAANLLRNHFRRPDTQSDVELDERPASGESPPAGAERDPHAERAEAIQRGLARLAPEQAALLAERHLEGEPLAALAARRGLSPRAVEGRLRRARAALAKHLDPELLDAGLADEPDLAS